MLDIQQFPVAPDNFRSGRMGHPIVGVVIHVEAGSEAGTDAWFDDPQAHVSAHYSVKKDGQIHQYVQESDTAFAVGVVDRPTWQWLIDHPGTNPNSWTISIEHEGLATDDWPDEQYAASAALIADICQRNSIPIDSTAIVGHHQIRFAKSCPGKGDVGRLIAMAFLIANGGSSPASPSD